MSLASARRAFEKASHPAIAHAGPIEAVQAAASAKIVDRIRILTPSARFSNQFVNENLIFVGIGHETIEETHAPARTPGLIDVRRRRTHRRACDVDMRPRRLPDESLDELRDARTSGGNAAQMAGLRTKLKAAQHKFESSLADVDKELAGVSWDWDAALDSDADEAAKKKLMERMNEVLNRRSYIRNLVNGVRQELATGE